MNKPHFGTLVAGVLLRPRRAFEMLSEAPRPRFGLGCGLLLGIVWAAFAALLAADGHRPTMDRGLPVAADRYYATAALYLAPLWVGLTVLTAGIAHGMARALGGHGRWAATLSTVGAAYALPLLTVYLVPDVIAYGVGGHGALAWGVKVGLPAAALLVLVRTVGAVRASHGLGTGRAVLAALVAGVIQAIPFGLLVR